MGNASGHYCKIKENKGEREKLSQRKRKRNFSLFWGGGLCIWYQKEMSDPFVRNNIHWVFCCICPMGNRIFFCKLILHLSSAFLEILWNHRTIELEGTSRVIYSSSPLQECRVVLFLNQPRLMFIWTPLKKSQWRRFCNLPRKFVPLSYGSCC